MSRDALERELAAVGERFNFGEYETEAYLTILEHGDLTAAELAERTDIPQPRVYDTVRSLADSGLVELHESRPMRVIAIDPEDSFRDVRSTLDDLVSGLSERYVTPAREEEVVSLVKSRQTILRYIEEVISEAEYELVLALTPTLLGRYEELLERRREAGVTIELLVAPAAEIPDPEEYDYSRVATTARSRRGVTTPVVAVADGEYSVYKPQDDAGNGEDRYGVIFNRSELGFLVSGFLNTVVWSSGTTLADSRDDRPFPRRYATMRRCVGDLLDRDERFYATVRGRAVESGDHRTVAGEIVDVSVGSNRETAAITVDTGETVVDVGGRLAALEDIEAYELAVGLEQPPEL
ncbi:TrmB family transcriptional regulator [Halovenus sp. WSH3]|uniref:TrmB family transcriptional regulator n=1 Tax=Halovenus carboxidivorans TaxID=2692199 RepID=A0A6B0SZH9_9EURY|nr:TrmB family transcriptional regulator [Halovenus carboxidivorans]MXR50915.1 TrmB family transcriptional regulator [Halovenus carboxidivorans]